MRIVKKLQENKSVFTEEQKEAYRKELLEAKFKLEKSGYIAQKVASVISKKIGVKIGMSTIPVKLKRQDGSFFTYFGFMADGRGIRFNFLMNSSALFHSVDLFDKAENNNIPTKTITLDGYNIIEVLDMIVAIINGEFEETLNESVIVQDKEDLKEADVRMKLIEMYADWVNNNPDVAKELETKGKLDFNDYSEDFLNYIRATFQSKKTQISRGSFMGLAKKAVDGKLINAKVSTAKVPGVSIKKGLPSDLFKADAYMQSLFEEAINPPPGEILDIIEETAILIAKGDPLIPGMFVYGQAGVGKTQTITDVFRAEGVKPVKVTLPVQGYSSFLDIIYNYKDDEIILFDDNDTVLKDEKVIGILKNILDSRPVRLVEVPVPVKTATQVIDQDFEFTSKIIFISNMRTLDEALYSRLSGVSYLVEFTPDEIVAMVKERLASFYKEVPTITDKMRMETLEFVERSLPASTVMDFRLFNYCLQVRHSAELLGHDTRKWHKTALAIIMKYGKI